ncbi:hypothetical protein B0H34DRAFT_671842 [Crassisporium funariophilum]|nr:hypothetical protein B0H34DRAFT_671842 [Crassisporium funariophilum]
MCRWRQVCNVYLKCGHKIPEILSAITYSSTPSRFPVTVANASSVRPIPGIACFPSAGPPASNIDSLLSNIRIAHCIHHTDKIFLKKRGDIPVNGQRCRQDTFDALLQFSVYRNVPIGEVTILYSPRLAQVGTCRLVTRQCKPFTLQRWGRWSSTVKFYRIFRMELRDTVVAVRVNVVPQVVYGTYLIE